MKKIYFLFLSTISVVQATSPSLGGVTMVIPQNTKVYFDFDKSSGGLEINGLDEKEESYIQKEGDAPQKGMSVPQKVEEDPFDQNFEGANEEGQSFPSFPSFPSNSSQTLHLPDPMDLKGQYLLGEDQAREEGVSFGTKPVSVFDALPNLYPNIDEKQGQIGASRVEEVNKEEGAKGASYEEAEGRSFASNESYTPSFEGGDCLFPQDQESRPVNTGYAPGDISQEEKSGVGRPQEEGWLSLSPQNDMPLENRKDSLQEDEQASNPQEIAFASDARPVQSLFKILENFSSL